MTVLQAVTVVAKTIQSLPCLNAVFDRETGEHQGQKNSNLHGTVRIVFSLGWDFSIPIDLQ